MTRRPLSIPARISSRRVTEEQHQHQHQHQQQQQQQHDTRTKAERVLGTGRGQFRSNNNEEQRNEGKSGGSRRSSILGLRSTSRHRKKTHFALFPTIYEESNKDASAPPAAATSSSFHLRARPSSPLLGQEYHRDDGGVPTVTLNAISSKESNPRVTWQDSQPTPTKEPPKKKPHPRKLDLSLLFPRPRVHEPALLSPHRLTRSPSPMHDIFDHAPQSPKNNTGTRGKRSFRSSLTDRMSLHPHKYVNDSLVPPEPPIWKDPEPRLYWAPSPSENYYRSSVPAASAPATDHLLPHPPPYDTYQSPSPDGDAPSPPPRTPIKRPQSHGTTLFRRPRVPYGSLRPSPQRPRRSSTDVLRSLDQYPTSVMFLSSDDESDQEQHRVVHHGIPTYYERLESGFSPSKLAGRPNLDSAFGSSGDRYLGRQAAPTGRAFGSTPLDLRRNPSTGRPLGGQASASRELRRNMSNSTARMDSGRQASASLDLRRNTSTSSARMDSGRQASASLDLRRNTSNSSARMDSGRSLDLRRNASTSSASLFSTLKEPAPLEQSSSMARRRRSNRRSRIIAVTREEQQLLEAMRRTREEKMGPSLATSVVLDDDASNDDRLQPIEKDPKPFLSVPIPSQDSFFGGSDISSVLRLSDNTPDSVEPKSDGSYSESPPSSSTASPKTPVLPVHRFSPVSSHKLAVGKPLAKPPQEPLPAIPLTRELRTSRRADSRDGLIDLDAEGSANDEFPIWAYGWCLENSL